MELDSKNMSDLGDKKYRQNVAAIVLSDKYPSVCEFFLGERHDLKGIWQFPQGGIDDGESPQDALLRELGEEIGTSEIEILASMPNWLSYDFPPGVKERMKPYVGQNQKYFLVKLKKDSSVNIDTLKPEFCRYEFVDYEELLNRINHFKKGVYMKALSYFRKEGYI